MADLRHGRDALRSLTFPPPERLSGIPMENIMYDVKSIFASKTIWGGIIALVASAAAIWGYSVTPADQAQIVELITGIGGAIGSVLAIYGRIVATKKIA